MDFNRACLSATPINAAINALIEAAAEPEINNRQYLGASSIGSECLRRVQYDWMVDAVHPQRMRDIFFRGDVFENRSRELLAGAGFRFEPDAAALNFSAVGGLFCGHADGIITAGPDLPGLALPHLGAQMYGLARMEEIERDGIEKARPQYHAQVLLYQAYSTSPIPRCSRSSTPTPANGCTCSCPSTLSTHRPGATEQLR